MGKTTPAPTRASKAVLSIFLILLLNSINKIRQAQYLAMNNVLFADKIVPITVTLYLSHFIIQTKKAIPKGAIDSTSIDLLSKNPITINDIIVNVMYLPTILKLLVFIKSFSRTAALLCISKTPSFVYIKSLSKA